MAWLPASWRHFVISHRQTSGTSADVRLRTSTDAAYADVRLLGTAPLELAKDIVLPPPPGAAAFGSSRLRYVHVADGLDAFRQRAQALQPAHMVVTWSTPETLYLDNYRALWTHLHGRGEVLLMGVCGTWHEDHLQLLLVPFEAQCASSCGEDDPRDPVLLAWFLPVKGRDLAAVDACLPRYRAEAAPPGWIKPPPAAASQPAGTAAQPVRPAPAAQPAQPAQAAAVAALLQPAGSMVATAQSAAVAAGSGAAAAAGAPEPAVASTALSRSTCDSSASTRERDTTALQGADDMMQGPGNTRVMRARGRSLQHAADMAGGAPAGRGSEEGNAGGLDSESQGAGGAANQGRDVGEADANSLGSQGGAGDSGGVGAAGGTRAAGTHGGYRGRKAASGGGGRARSGSTGGAGSDAAEQLAGWRRDLHLEDSTTVLKKVVERLQPRRSIKGSNWVATVARYPPDRNGLPDIEPNVHMPLGHLAQVWPPFCYVNNLYEKPPESVLLKPEVLPHTLTCKECLEGTCVHDEGRDAIERLRCDGVRHPLEIRRVSEKLGWGVFSRERIREGEHIVEYTGEVLRRHEDHRTREQTHRRAGWLYMFDMPDRRGGACGRRQAIIDGTHMGNVSRFINHHCAPNCNITQVCMGGDDSALRLLVTAVRDIEPGGELYISYWGEDVSKVEVPKDKDLIPPRFRCFCGAEGCQGVIVQNCLNEEDQGSQPGPATQHHNRDTAAGPAAAAAAAPSPTKQPRAQQQQQQQAKPSRQRPPPPAPRDNTVQDEPGPLKRPNSSTPGDPSGGDAPRPKRHHVTKTCGGVGGY